MDKRTNRILPLQAVLTLQAAARTDNDRSDPLRRQKAIERAIEEVRAKWPDFFVTEKEVDDDQDRTE